MKFVLIVLVLVLSWMQKEKQLNLEIEITGLKNDNGYVMFQLFDVNQKVIGQYKESIRDKRSLVNIKDLKQGQYAFRYFHDENLSGEMETNRLGIPLEGYGFSNRGAGPFGPRDFSKWLFKLDNSIKIESKIRY